MKDKMTVFHSTETHPAKTYASAATAIVGKDDLVSRQGHLHASREDNQRARGTVLHNWQLPGDVTFPVNASTTNESNEQGEGVIHELLLYVAPARS